MVETRIGVVCVDVWLVCVIIHHHPSTCINLVNTNLILVLMCVIHTLIAHIQHLNLELSNIFVHLILVEFREMPAE